jgi:hypothetical protein
MRVFLFIAFLTLFLPTLSTINNTFIPQCNYPAFFPETPCAAVTECYIYLRKKGSTSCIVSPSSVYTNFCQNSGTAVFGASWRGKGFEEESTCLDVAEALWWILENCEVGEGVCQGEYYVAYWYDELLIGVAGAATAIGNGNLVVVIA